MWKHVGNQDHLFSFDANVSSEEHLYANPEASVDGVRRGVVLDTDDRRWRLR